MEFHEKLQELRKSRGLTQEELAELLYVSRTAVSKWESGRGYPSIDSLKGIAAFFSVTIDDLLSGDQLISIAEKENKTNIGSICDFLFGIIDLCTVLLILLPLYPNTLDRTVYPVNLFHYTETSVMNLIIYWIIFVSLIGLGMVKLVLAKWKTEKNDKYTTYLSLCINIFGVLYLALAREAYATILVFLLLLIKGMVFFKCIKMGR